jgi:hypothetical protein
MNKETDYILIQQKIYSYYNYDKILILLFIMLLLIYFYVIFSSFN